MCGLDGHVETALLITPHLSTACPAPWSVTWHGSASLRTSFVPLTCPVRCACCPTSVHDCANQQAPAKGADSDAILHEVPHFTSSHLQPGKFALQSSGEQQALRTGPESEADLKDFNDLITAFLNLQYVRLGQASHGCACNPAPNGPVRICMSFCPPHKQHPPGRMTGLAKRQPTSKT